MSNSDLETPRDLSTLVGLLKIFFLIVLLNITLYLAIVYFAIVNFHRTVPVFLAFIQFLAFILPIVLILRVGLKEAPAVGPIDNPYLKKIGATPSLVILSCFAAFLATFTPMSAQIFPKPDSFPTSMVAKVGVACRISSDLNASKGAYFLTVIWSDDTEYIKAVRSNLRALQIANSADAKKLDDVRTSNIYQLAEATLKSFMEMLGLVSATTAPAHDETYSQLKLVEKSDQFYKLLKQNTPVGDENSELRWGLSDDLRWAAFTIPVKAPEEYTQVPIHTQFGMRNHTKVFLLTFPDHDGPSNISGNPLEAAAPVPPRGSQNPKFELRRISEVEILSKRPDTETQSAELNLNIFPTKSCWTTSPNDS